MECNICGDTYQKFQCHSCGSIRVNDRNFNHRFCLVARAQNVLASTMRHAHTSCIIAARRRANIEDRMISMLDMMYAK